MHGAVVMLLLKLPNVAALHSSLVLPALLVRANAPIRLFPRFQWHKYDYYLCAVLQTCVDYTSNNASAICMMNTSAAYLKSSLPCYDPAAANIPVNHTACNADSCCRVAKVRQQGIHIPLLQYMSHLAGRARCYLGRASFCIASAQCCSCEELVVAQ